MSNLFPQSVTAKVDIDHTQGPINKYKILTPRQTSTFHIDLPVVRRKSTDIVIEVDSDRELLVDVLHGFDCDGNEYLIRVPTESII